MWTAEMESKVVETLRGNALGYGAGSITRRFEDNFAQYSGRRFAIATNSGTSALLSAYFAMGLGSPRSTTEHKPDEVIVPAFGFFATVSPLIWLGVKPVFCDVEYDTGNIDTEAVSRCITPHTKAIVVTHIDGHPAEMDSLCKLASSVGIPIVEDCSHAHGSRYKGRLVGSFGSVAAFSFQTSKMLSAGEGGMLVTDSEDLFIRAAALGNFRRLEGTTFCLPSALQITGLGLKLRMGPLEAALAEYHLSRLDELIGQRSRNLARLSEGIKRVADAFVITPTIRDHVTRGAYYEYALKYRSSAEAFLSLSAFRAALKAEGVKVLSSNTCAIHRMQLLSHGVGYSINLFSDDGAAPDNQESPSMPIAEHLESQSLYLPPFTTPSDSLVDQYVLAFEKICAQAKSISEAYQRRPEDFS